MNGVCNDVLAMIHRYVHRANMNNVMVDLRYQTQWIYFGINEYCCVANSYNYNRYKLRIVRSNYININDTSSRRRWDYRTYIRRINQ